jgi:hypothetical protein
MVDYDFTRDSLDFTWSKGTLKLRGFLVEEKI